MRSLSSSSGGLVAAPPEISVGGTKRERWRRRWCLDDSVVVGGVRYVGPEERWRTYSVQLAAPVPILDWLGSNAGDGCGRRWDGAWWAAAVAEGRVRLWRRSPEAIAARRPAAASAAPRGGGNLVVIDNRSSVRDKDVIEVLEHVHERAVLPGLPAVLCETAHFVVVNKPAGVPTQARTDGLLNLLNLLQRRREDPQLWLGHRLDLPVSGVCVLGRSTRQQHNFLEAIKAGKCEKRYLARVWPGPSSPLADARRMVNADEASFLDTDPFNTEDEDGGGGGGGGLVVECADRMGFSKDLAVPGPQEARTRFAALRAFKDGSLLVLCAPTHGRRHQIRFHLQQVGAPIVDDVAYGGHLPEGKEPLKAYADDAAGTLASLFARHRRPWCPACDWAAAALAGDRPLPDVQRAISLHAASYRCPSLGLDVQAPWPPWALED